MYHCLPLSARELTAELKAIPVVKSLYTLRELVLKNCSQPLLLNSPNCPFCAMSNTFSQSGSKRTKKIFVEIIKTTSAPALVIKTLVTARLYKYCMRTIKQTKKNPPKNKREALKAVTELLRLCRFYHAVVCGDCH